MALGASGFIFAGCTSSQASNLSTKDNSDSTTQQVQTQSTSAKSNNQSLTQTYSMTDVSAANSEQKCWTAVNGKVYDLTSFINKHPGGKANILKICGKDGTAAFGAQHSGQKRPESELASLQIGVLK